MNSHLRTDTLFSPDLVKVRRQFLGLLAGGASTAVLTCFVRAASANDEIRKPVVGACLFVFTLCFSLGAIADEPAQKVDLDATNAFVVYVDEYELSEPIAAGMAKQQILKLVAHADTDDDVVRVRTYATSTMVGVLSTVKFIQRKARLIAWSRTPLGELNRGFEDTSLGTTLEVQIEAQAAGLELRLKYEMSTLLDSQGPTIPETAKQNLVQTSLRVRIGEPQLCAVLQADKTTIITVRVEGSGQARDQ